MTSYWPPSITRVRWLRRQATPRTVTATVPATSGPKYVLVHTKPGASLREVNEANNLGVSSYALAVDVPLLELGTPINGTVTSRGLWDYYRFEGEPGRMVPLLAGRPGGRPGPFPPPQLTAHAFRV